MELEIDQSHLPRVEEAHTESPAVPSSVKHTSPESGANELCQCFAVLEDGALAYNLQEQEIEQYYSSNVQKSQLVQNDIRMARQLQDEEELFASRAARQLEERDSEYARQIQEEIQRCAVEEARRREEEDEEMAKRLQEEEEMGVHRQRLDRGRHGEMNDILPREERAGAPEPSRPRRPVRSPRRSNPSPNSSSSDGEARSPSTNRGHSRGSNTDSDSEAPLPKPQGTFPQNNSAPQHVFRQNDGLRLIRNLLRESLGPRYNIDDEVFLRPLGASARRPQKQLNTAPSGPQGLDRHSFASSVGEGEGWEERLVGTRSHGNRDERWHCNTYHGDLRRQEEDYRSHQQRPHDLVYSRPHRQGEEPRYRHVHFQDDRRRYNSFHGDSRRETPAASYQNNFSDRGVAARRSCYGDYRQVQRSGSQGNYEKQRVGAGGSRHLSEVLMSNRPTRRSYHGDFRDRRRNSGGDDRRGYGDHGSQIERRSSYRENQTIQEDRVYRLSDYHNDRSGQGDHRNRRSWQGDFHSVRSSQDGGDSRDWEGGNHGDRRGRGEGGGAGRDRRGDGKVRRSVSERLQACEEPGSSSEEEQRWRAGRRQSEGGRREEGRPQTEGVRRSVSFSGRTPPPTDARGGAGAASRRDGASLELGELRQLLRDEEFARVLQEEEERLLRKTPTSLADPPDTSPRGDFRAAQVAQDEEIARFIQQSERKARRRSSDHEGQGSRREQQDSDSGQEGRSTRARQVESAPGPRERLDSQGLNSASDDLSPECQPPSPSSPTSPLQTVRNIAEELDPTFKGKRRDSNSAGLGSPGLSTSPSSPSGLHDYPQEPTFVPPTKRQSDKSARSKAKEKKESCKQQ
ncbi:hypothetical protein GJAV_G00169890 [Gymnothorax javanicus]|nr:hypothetical protein GJAV_G00169890 [Gymnothorax javanicus]